MDDNKSWVYVPLPQTIINTIDAMAQYLGPDTDRTSVASVLIVAGAKNAQAELEAGKKIKVNKKVWASNRLKEAKTLTNVALPQTLVDGIDVMAEHFGPDTDRTSVAASLIIRGAKVQMAEMKATQSGKLIWLPGQK